MRKVRSRLLIGASVTIILFTLGLLFLLPTAPSKPLPIRLSGVATNTTPNGSCWRVEVPEPNNGHDPVVSWTVWIQETNRNTLGASQPQSVALSQNENDLLSWPISEIASGIITWSGPKLSSNKLYRAVGACIEPPSNDWRIRVFQSPLRPVLRFVPERKPTFATSDWVEVTIQKTAR